MKQLITVLFVALATTVFGQPYFITPPSGDKCVGINVLYRAPVFRPVPTYAWSVPGTAGTDYTIVSGSFASNSSSCTVKWLTTGSKTVTVNWTGSGSPTPAGSTVSVWTNPIASFTAYPAANTCYFDSSVWVTQSGMSNYIWTGTGSYSSRYGGTTTDSYFAGLKGTGTVNISVKYTDSHGCISNIATASTTLYTYYGPLYVAPVSAQPVNTDLEYSAHTTYSNFIWAISGTEGIDYNITAGGLSTSDNTVTLQWLNTTPQTIGLTDTDPNGCINSDSWVVNPY